MATNIVLADYSNPLHQRDIPLLLDIYAHDPMGGGKPLSSYVKNSLVRELSKIPSAFSILAYNNEIPVGLINCFEGFSTFSCKPLINLHDVIVRLEFRGIGIFGKMLSKVEEIALAKNCCKITLEVLGDNETAQSTYRKHGYAPYQLAPCTGSAQFWQKLLDKNLSKHEKHSTI